MKNNIKQENIDIIIQKLYQSQINAITLLQEKIGYNFKEQSILIEALTHRSAISQIENYHRHKTPKDTITDQITLKWYEKLEFLGDSILGAAISSLLWKQNNHHANEGILSRQRANIVNQSSLAKLAYKLDVEKCILLSFAEEKNGGLLRESLLADVLEAIIGAIYIDSNSYDTTYKVIQNLFKSQLSLQNKDLLSYDYKTILQEKYQESIRITPIYKTLQALGPDHRKRFEVAVLLETKQLSTGWGDSKKQASQEAAKNALTKHSHNEPPHFNTSILRQ